MNFVQILAFLIFCSISYSDIVFQFFFLNFSLLKSQILSVINFNLFVRVMNSACDQFWSYSEINQLLAKESIDNIYNFFLITTSLEQHMNWKHIFSCMLYNNICSQESFVKFLKILYDWVVLKTEYLLL